MTKNVLLKLVKNYRYNAKLKSLIMTNISFVIKCLQEDLGMDGK
jgi:hypothetical protein